MLLMNNTIGDEGGKVIGGALKDNTSLTILNLYNMNKVCFVIWMYCFNCINNEIGNEGAKAIGEALKINTSLTELSLSETAHHK